MLTDTIDDLYLSWLYARIGMPSVASKRQTYWELLKLLNAKEFVGWLPNDINRVEDGRYLRYQFLDEENLRHVDPNWMGRGCSTLEMLIALCYRLSFETSREPHLWFWELMNNLGLSAYNDRDYHQQMAEDIIDTLIWRKYHYDGTGGLFPMQHPEQDQREIELWYQKEAYIQEQHY